MTQEPHTGALRVFETRKAERVELLPDLVSRHTENGAAVKGAAKPKDTKVAIAQGLHLFPFRTEKLNLATPMILRKLKSR